MKLKEFQHYLQEQGIDAAFFVHPDISITYFTQFVPSFAYLLIFPKEAILYLTRLDKKPTLKDISVQEIKKGWEKEFAQHKVKTIALNKESLSLAFFEKLQKLYPEARFVDCSQKIKELRKQKTRQEINYIQEACHIATKAFAALLPVLNKLPTETSVASFLEQSMKEQGAEPSFPTIVATGKNAATPHHRASLQKLTRGPLQLDFGARYRNYCSDMSRVVFLGTPTKEEREKYELLLKVQEATIGQVEEGKSFSELQSFAQQQLGKYAKHFTHSLGHGIGLEVHEAPSFSQQTEKIAQSQVFTIEPGIYFPGKFGLRIEDTLAFNTQARILTTAPKDFITVLR